MLTCGAECNDDGFIYLETLSGIQQTSDILISFAYLYIPLQLFSLITCSKLKLFPVRWIVIQFVAFISLSGLTHLLIFLTNTSLLSYRLMLTLTILKSLTAIVSCGTAVTLVTIIPQTLQAIYREGLLRKKIRELDEELVVLKKREEAIRHVRMLTTKIRSSLDKYEILFTTLVELARAFHLENCSIWMPDESNLTMNLVHELKPRHELGVSVPIVDPELMEIVAERSVRVLRLDSRFGPGPGIAIRLPLLRVSDFRGGPEKYAILVLVLKAGDNRCWRPYEVEIVEVVADQVTVALSHAAVLEESLSIKEKLLEQNRALKKARETTLMANEALSSFQEVMGREMIAPSRSIAAIISVLQTENWESEQQKRIVNTMAKGEFLLSAAIEDATGVTQLGGSRIELKSCNFSLHSMLQEVVRVSKFLCSCRGLGFHFEADNQLLDHVIGDDMRIIQALLYMVGKVSVLGDCGGVILSVCTQGESQDSLNSKYFAWKRAMSEEFTDLIFHVRRTDVKEDGSSLFKEAHKAYGNKHKNQGLKLCILEKLAQLINGSIAVGRLDGRLELTIRLQLSSSKGGLVPERSMDPETACFLLKGMNTLLVDNDSFNQSIVRKLLENLGCHLAVATTWRQCLESLRLKGHKYHLLLIDLAILEQEGAEDFVLIRKLRMESWLLVIALVAVKANKDTLDRCLRRGIHGVISKPVVKQELEDELQRIFQHPGRVHSPTMRVSV